MLTTRLVLWDIDGTLLTTDGAGRESLCEAFNALFEPSDIDAASRRISYGGRTDPLIVEELAREAGIPEDIFLPAREAMFRHYLQALERRLATDRTTVLPGVSAVLDRLAERPDVTLGLLTGNIEGGARLKLRAAGLEHRFETGGFGSDHSVRRQIARIAREKVEARAGERFAAGEVAVIGDTRHDVDCARANGFRAVAVATGGDGVDGLRASGADAVLDDLGDPRQALAALGVPD